MEEMEIKSNYDQLGLSVLVLNQKGKARGVIQISHGMAEHKERYKSFMKFLNSKGYITVIHDHRGHGKSIKDKDDLGYFYDSKGEGIVEDLHQITLFIKEKYPKLPITLIGHSMGSIVARKYIKKYDADIDKLILIGAPSENSHVNLGISLVIFLKKLKGERYRSKFINNLLFKNYNKNFKNDDINNAWLSSDLEIVKNYNKDKKCGFIFTLNGFLNLFIMLKTIFDAEEYLVRNYNLPILFMAGSLDPVIISRSDWENSQLFLKNVGYQNVKGILYSNMRHEILNEKDSILVYQDVLEFIEN